MKKIETERKYIISKPDMSIVARQEHFTESDITQIYLVDTEQTHRIRKRVYGDGTVEYTENFKRRISSMSFVESEENISRELYEELRLKCDPKTIPLEKKRVTFFYLGKTIEIDIYPNWESTCILEVELDRECEDVSFPSFIRVMRDVTGMREYSNHSMAHRFPNEPTEI